MATYLITSGGTQIPIDRVRHIGNMSSGTFGSKIAYEALKKGHFVYFLKAKGSKSPFDLHIDVNTQHIISKVAKNLWFKFKYKNHYEEWEYKTFEDYKNELEAFLSPEKGVLGADPLPDVVILAAAVSDYGVENPVDGKIRSKGDLDIHLTPLPKLISSVRQKLGPSRKLVGFKLLVDSTDEQLQSAVLKSVYDNKCDMVVGNDLRDIKNNDHKLMIGFPNGPVMKFQGKKGDSNFLASSIVSYVDSMGPQWEDHN